MILKPGCNPVGAADPFAPPRSPFNGGPPADFGAGPATGFSAPPASGPSDPFASSAPSFNAAPQSFSGMPQTSFSPGYQTGTLTCHSVAFCSHYKLST